MNIIIVGRRHGTSTTITLGTFYRRLIFLSLVLIPFLSGFGGYWLTSYLADEDVLDSSTAKIWEQDLESQKSEIVAIREDAERELSGLTVRIAEMQGRLLRLDALGERLVDVARIEGDEFDFSAMPAVGGPESASGSYQVMDINTVLDELTARVESREKQLQLLDNLMTNKGLDEEIFVAGRPIVKGWMSSRYGTRTDPFTGRPAWHAGVDFAGKMGSDIVSVATGVVTWSGKRYGYGLMVEVSHGNGYKTRYAHCLETKVEVGDVVRKGEIIATMGSSGRSTGPHVHFEVYKDNKTVDPARYIYRKFG